MLVFIAFALVLGLAGAWAYKSKPDDLVYKIAAGLLIVLSAYFLYMAIYYWQMGEDIRNFYNGGAGITYYYKNNTNVSQTITASLYTSNDTRVGEYLAVQKSDSNILIVFTPLLPVLTVFLVFYSVYWVMQQYYFKREGGDKT